MLDNSHTCGLSYSICLAVQEIRQRSGLKTDVLGQHTPLTTLILEKSENIFLWLRYNLTWLFAVAGPEYVSGKISYMK